MFASIMADWTRAQKQIVAADPAAATTFPKPRHSKPVPAWHGWADFTFTLHEMFLYQCNVFFLHKRLHVQHCIYDVVLWPEVLCLALTIAQLHVFFHVPWSPFEFLLILFPQPCKEFLNIRIPGFLHIKMQIVGRVVKLMTSLQKTKTCNNKSFNFWAFPISSTSLPC